MMSTSPDFCAERATDQPKIEPLARRQVAGDKSARGVAHDAPPVVGFLIRATSTEVLQIRHQMLW